MSHRSVRVMTGSARKISSPESPSDFILFRDLAPEQFSQVSRLLHRKIFHPGDTILEAGQPAEALYLLLTGTVKICSEEDGEEERQIIYGLRGPGEVLGEVSLTDGLGHSATVVAEEETACWRMSRHDFENCLDNLPTVCRNLSRLLARRVRMVTEQVRCVGTQDVFGRVCRVLHLYARDYGVPHGNGSLLIPLRMTQNSIASMVGATRPRVSDACARLKRAGVVSVTPTDYHITIHDLDALKRPRG